MENLMKSGASGPKPNDDLDKIIKDDASDILMKIMH
jgi:hypothetical protein